MAWALETNKDIDVDIIKFYVLFLLQKKLFTNKKSAGETLIKIPSMSQQNKFFTFKNQNQAQYYNYLINRNPRVQVSNWAVSCWMQKKHESSCHIF